VEHPDEQQWVRKAQAGDREAFAALIEGYWGRVYCWLQGLTGRSHAAEDLTQEVFLRAWEELRTLQEGSRFRSWLFRIARNCFLDSRRGGVPHLPVRLLCCVCGLRRRRLPGGCAGKLGVSASAA